MSVSRSEAAEPGIALDLGSSMVVVSRSGTEYPRPPPLCTEALQGRELVWSMLPNIIYQGAIPCLTAQESLRLDSALTNSEARPHLVKSYKGMVSPGFNEYLYTDKEDYRALRWVMKKGIDLRGFRLEVGGEKGSGKILKKLVEEEEVVIAKYYVMRGKLCDMDEAVDHRGRYSSRMGSISWPSDHRGGTASCGG